jgi:hypothetical protein
MLAHQKLEFSLMHGIDQDAKNSSQGWQPYNGHMIKL